MEKKFKTGVKKGEVSVKDIMKKYKVEPKECTGADASGSFE